MSGNALAGKVVVVTGSSRGIGLAVARACAAQGARVVLNGRSAKALDKARRDLGGDVPAVRADVSTDRGARRLLDAVVRAYGGFDVLVLNAARPGPAARPAWTIPPRAWRRTVAADLDGPFLCAARFAGWLAGQERAGRIVAVLSEGAARGAAGLAPYCAAKAGFEMLTRCLALDAEAAGRGLCVVGLRLAAHRTPMTRSRLDPEDLERLPGPRGAVPLFLAAMTAEASAVHGRILSESRFARDPAAEIRLAGPLATVRPFVPRMPRFEDPVGGTFVDFLENPLGAPPAAVEAVRAAAADLARYPDPRLGRLRAALGERLGLDGRCFSFGAGVSELVARCLATFCREGDGVVTGDPTWPMVERMCDGLGLDLRLVPCRIDIAARAAGLDLDALAAAIDGRTRLVYLVDPHYPLGFGLDRARLRRFLEGLPAGVVAVLDETYVEFAEPDRAGDTPRLVAEGGAAVIGLRGFSKFHGLAGLRLGYAFARPDLIDLLGRLEVTFAVGGLTEAAAVAALADEGHAARTRALIDEGRAAIIRRLDGLGLGHLPSEANFVMAQSPAPPDEVLARLESEGLHIPQAVWANCLQLPIAGPADNERVLDVLASYR